MPASPTSTRVAFLPWRGKAAQFCTLSLEQQDQLAEYLRFRYMEETRRQVDGLQGPLAEYAWDQAKAKSDNIYPGRREHAELAFTFPGFCYALTLAAQKYTPGFDETAATEVLEERTEDAVEVVRKVLGYEKTDSGERAKNEALPVPLIVHMLTNEPYCHTPAEVKAMSIDEIAIIWTESGKQGNKGLNMAQQAKFVEEARRRKEAKCLGMWGQPSVW